MGSVESSPPPHRLRERLCNDLRRFRRDQEECTRRPMRLPATLLPILKGRDAHADHARKLRLGFMKLLSDRADIFRIEGELASCWHFASVDLASFFDTCDEIVEQFFLHLNSARIRLRSAFFSSADKSSRSVLEYRSNK